MRALAAAIVVLVWCGAGVAAAARHRVRIEGAGRVTVVFENGLGDSLEVWRRVQPRVARCARTFAYNRAGYPGSPGTSDPRDAAHVVTELRAELAARGVPPPYVLVGHSLGGLYAQYFARRHPAEIAGVVLVDATHWNHLERLRAESPGTWRTLRALSLLMRPVMRRELDASTAAGAQVLALSPAPAPTIVLSSSVAAPGESAAFRSLQRRMQSEIAAAGRTVRHEFVDGSGHYIQQDRPEAVMRAIEELADCD
jgi:pimeloyl-ACP methyl ester carboxylesterase